MRMLSISFLFLCVVTVLATGGGNDCPCTITDTVSSHSSQDCVTYTFTGDANECADAVQYFLIQNPYPIRDPDTQVTVSVPAPYQDCPVSFTPESFGPTACTECECVERQQICESFEKYTVGQTHLDTSRVTYTSSQPVSNPATIFNTSSPTGGDCDLGTPNEDFGGPGCGAGGESGMPYQNDEALGNVLIVSMFSQTTPPPNFPNDNADGGLLIIELQMESPDQAFRLDEVTLLDVDDSSGDIRVRTYDFYDTELESVTSPITGDNGVVTITSFSELHVKVIEIELEGSGAVGEFCYTTFDHCPIPPPPNGGGGCDDEDDSDDCSEDDSEDDSGGGGGGGESSMTCCGATDLTTHPLEVQVNLTCHNQVTVCMSPGSAVLFDHDSGELQLGLVNDTCSVCSDVTTFGNQAACSDNDDCRDEGWGRWCSGGRCRCNRDSHCGDFDGDVCTVEQCIDGECRRTLLDCDDCDPCTEDVCHPDTGCEHIPIPGCCVSDDECHDSNACTWDMCVENECVYSQEVDCDDDDFCTQDACDPDTGMCIYTPTDCDDGVNCTVDSCSSHLEQCVNTPDNNACDDGDICTTDVCDEDDDCVFTPIPNCCEVDGDCDDGDICTTDVCNTQTNQCEFTEIPGCCETDEECDDGIPCTSDTCVMNECMYMTNCTVGACEFCNLTSGACESECDGACMLCNSTTDMCYSEEAPDCCVVDEDCEDFDMNVCTENPCDIDNNQCLVIPINCTDDGNPCTEEVCDPTFGCMSHPIPGCCLNDSQCSLGDFNESTVCDLALCNTTNNECYLDVFGVAEPPDCCVANVTNCTEALGESMNLTVCDLAFCNATSNACEVETVPAPECCVVNDDCTLEQFENATVCDLAVCNMTTNRCELVEFGVAEPPECCVVNVTNCTEAFGDAMQNLTVCDMAFCNASSNACEIETIPAPECCVVNGDCDDGDFCTQDACVNNTCVYSSTDCSDGVNCTVDVCNSTLGQCVSTPNDSLCVDPDVCTQGFCNVTADCQFVVTPPPECCVVNVTNCTQFFPNATVCQQAVCDPDQNDTCVLEDIEDCCLTDDDCPSDDDPCTDDICLLANNTCIYPPKNCSDGIDCTVDLCHESTGDCLNIPDDNLCDDGDPCTEEVCSLVNDCETLSTTPPPECCNAETNCSQFVDTSNFTACEFVQCNFTSDACEVGTIPAPQCCVNDTECIPFFPNDTAVVFCNMSTNMCEMQNCTTDLDCQTEFIIDQLYPNLSACDVPRCNVTTGMCFLEEDALPEPECCVVNETNCCYAQIGFPIEQCDLGCLVSECVNDSCSPIEVADPLPEECTNPQGCLVELQCAVDLGLDLGDPDDLLYIYQCAQCIGEFPNFQCVAQRGCCVTRDQCLTNETVVDPCISNVTCVVANNSIAGECQTTLFPEETCFGACCLANETCLDIQGAMNESCVNGTWQGNGTACNETECRTSFCGDGIVDVEAGEECDSTPGCLPDCTMRPPRNECDWNPEKKQCLGCCDDFDNSTSEFCVESCELLLYYGEGDFRTNTWPMEILRQQLGLAACTRMDVAIIDHELLHKLRVIYNMDDLLGILDATPRCQCVYNTSTYCPDITLDFIEGNMTVIGHANTTISGELCAPLNNGTVDQLWCSYSPPEVLENPEQLQCDIGACMKLAQPPTEFDVCLNETEPIVSCCLENGTCIEAIEKWTCLMGLGGEVVENCTTDCNGGPLGACCLDIYNGECVDQLTEQQCLSMNASLFFTADETCETVDCPLACLPDEELGRYATSPLKVCCPSCRGPRFGRSKKK